METGDVNEELRQAVEKALGNAALKDDEDVRKFCSLFVCLLIFERVTI